jgi:hypothetical protein
VLFALAAYTALQALPLPSSWVRLLSPNAAEVWQRAFDVAPSSGWMSLSLDRGATLVEVLKWATYGAAFVAAAGVGSARGMARGLLPIVAAPVLVALVTLAHGLVGARAIYGFYEPTIERSIWHTGPLLNPNHLASYLNFGIFCGMGLLAARKPVVPVWVVGLAIAFLIPNALVAGSRGGVIGLLVGLVVFFAASPKAGNADRDFGPVPKTTVLASLAAVFVVAIGFTALLASEQTARQLYDGNIDKIRLLSWCRALIVDYPWFGVGRGSFESVFTAYRSGTSNEIFTHPENLPVQWLGEWGIPVGLVGAGLLCWVLRPRRLGLRWSVVSTGVVAAVAAIVAQNFVDFGLEVPAIALTVVVALGVCWGHANRRRRGASEESPGKDMPALALVAVVVVLSGLVLGAGFRPLVYERRELAQAADELADAAPSDIRAMREVAARAVLAHPSEPYFYRMAALLTWRLGEDPMPWLQRALDRGPSVGRTHLLVARVVASRKAIRQALFELRLAATFDPNLAHAVARAALSWTQGYDNLRRAVPHGEAGIQMLTVMVRQPSIDAVTHERLLMELVERDPRRLASLTAMASYYVQELERGDASVRCAVEQRAGCLAEAERWLTALDGLTVTDTEGVLLRSRLLQVRGSVREALALLTERCATLAAGARSRCLQKRLELAARAAQTLEFAAAATDFVADACLDSEQCSGALERVADMNGSRGDWQAALSFYERAARERSDDRLWIKVARSAVRVGAFGRVASALGRIRSRARFEPEYSRLLQSVGPGQAREASQ